ncbi:protein-methionine-sulfoxide reductase heme-binding subunit MsrQ [Cronobacter turicensis]|uniref:protein-methionine-sulfoxide reductase heme-binding subunit MsrQ n=1 Tax=Cronobacter turicensis TaxID=413502 RepID=UPI0024C27802|nr:protein-methionine-sulfoxide reductase heme-binding subunit MsrQ [Cronobacter turicensis]MDK1185225.1 protein-methionine-sulfoxide reductase heme-binding subunit MsrQ [Cronobacter turicensis]MDK1206316.1 protein-methionine-sulfoxide reductase heme-binding subunit MsrQ [Cronobacter turicensis]MDK1216125.1 protein-methionine-sulfoxide reductase heme-binding subunit MsrQ [Cronobacter turicensis]MDK1219059.1 protein-methionine-sulfoxide reductase heme-binding subunit MsrQ [Cronobacter turicensis
MRLTAKQITWLKVALHLAAFLPLVWLFYAASQGLFSADPAKDIQHFTGRMALKLLLGTLLVTPLTRLLKQPLLIRTRRLLGLWCFAWATLHLVSYSLLELGLSNLSLLGSELVSRPYLTLGVISWLILLALALTSFQAAQRKLGRRWQTVHNFIYLVAILAPIHYLWSVKILSPQPMLYALGAILLLAWRYKKLRQWWRT